MQVSTASSSGRDGRANEDFVVAVPGAVVLLDGAGVPGMEEVCRHSVRWYVQKLGTTLLRLLATDPSALLTEALAQALQEVADGHRDTCDLEDPRGPMATVVIARVRDEAVDVLVLADAFVVVEPLVGLPEVITDPREVAVRGECLALLAGVAEGTSEHAERLAQVVADFRSRRNARGGYWIAKDDPIAAAHAVTARREVSALRSVSLLSTTARAGSWTPTASRAGHCSFKSCAPEDRTACFSGCGRPSSGWSGRRAWSKRPTTQPSPTATSARSTPRATSPTVAEERQFLV